MKATLCRLDDIPREGTLQADLFGREVLIFRNGGAPRAMLNYCQHMGGPLELRDDRFVCTWHGSHYGRDGRCISGPAAPSSRLIVLPVRERQGRLECLYDNGTHADAVSRRKQP